MMFNVLVAQKDDEASAVNTSALMNDDHSTLDKTKGVIRESV